MHCHRRERAAERAVDGRWDEGEHHRGYGAGVVGGEDGAGDGAGGEGRVPADVRGGEDLAHGWSGECGCGGLRGLLEDSDAGFLGGSKMWRAGCFIGRLKRADCC